MIRGNSDDGPSVSAGDAVLSTVVAWGLCAGYQVGTEVAVEQFLKDDTVGVVVFVFTVPSLSIWIKMLLHHYYYCHYCICSEMIIMKSIVR